MSFSSLVLRSGVFSLAAFSFLSTGVDGLTSMSYALTTTYSGSTFFDGFDFFTDPDPTNGFVTYVDRNTAQSKSMISSGPSAASYIGVDFTTTLNVTGSVGRSSVRISSKASFTHGLIISDIAHMPGGICGTWPAHWTLGPNWPTTGEIDIIEGVNAATENLMSMHTSPGCTIAGSQESGTLQTNNCDTSVNYNSGCGVTSSLTSSYGTGFNSINGGVYATQWTSDYVKIWFFPRSAGIPQDITSGTPNPANWGLPAANFQGSCNIDSKLSNHSIIFDTTFCGDYAGSVWSTSSCSGQASSCNAYVAANPSAFANAYWSINSVKVYQLTAGTTTASTSSLSSAVPQSSVLGPGMASNQTATSAPFSAATQAGNVATVGSFKYLGCASSTSAFSNFVKVDDSSNMSIERCTSECSNYSYAGTFNTSCFCANALDSSTSVTAGSGMCTKPCPGNPSELCGGTVSSKLRSRQLSASTLISLYVSNGAASGVHFGSVSVNVNVNVDILVSVAPAYSVYGYGMGGGANTKAVFSATYVSACPVCPGGVTTIATTTTLPHCGCVGGVTLVNPLATIINSCNTCAAGPAVVAYVPAQPTMGGGWNGTGPVLFKGAAERTVVGVELIAGIVGFIVLGVLGLL